MPDNNHNEWYENKILWETLAPFLYTPERVATIPVQISQIVGLLGLNAHESILDLCCGEGHFAVGLAKRGFNVTGIDYMSTFVRRARYRARSCTAHCNFITGDILKFCHRQAFDVIINVFHSFGYFDRDEDNYNILKNAYASLRTGGRLLMDMLSKDQILLSSSVANHYERDGLILDLFRGFDERHERVIDRWVVSKGESQQEFLTSTRIYSADELSDLLLSVGFACVQIWGGVDGREYKEHAGRLVVIAKKGPPCSASTENCLIGS